MQSLLLLFLTSCILGVRAKSLLAVFGGPVNKGESYSIEWVTDAQEYLELLLVRQGTGNVAWTAINTLFENRLGNPPGDSYNWTVNASLPAGGGYGLWLSSTPTNDSSSGYADLTDWFTVREADGSLPSTATSSISASSSVSSRSAASATSATASLTTSSAAQTSSQASSVSSGDGGLSTGALAGIIVGSVLAGMLSVAGAFFAFRHAKRRKAAAAELDAADHRRSYDKSELDATSRPIVGKDHKYTYEPTSELAGEGGSERAELPGPPRPPVEKDVDGNPTGEKQTAAMNPQELP